MATEQTCNACNRIKIFKGDDTNWNGEQFLTVNVSSQDVDLSSMTARFILGNFSHDYPLEDGFFKVDLSSAVTGVYSFGPMDGVIKILDSEKRIKTVSNTIPFFVTDKVIDQQDAVYNVEVSPNSPLDIDITIGYGTISWGEITGTLSNQTDLAAALYQKVSKVGDTMTGDLVMDNAAVDFGDFKVSADDGLAKIEGTQYGLRVDTTSGLGAALLTTRGLGEVLTTLDIKDTYSGNSSDPISGKGVAQAISTKQDTLTAPQLTAVNSGIDSTKVSQIATNAQNITNEATARVNADNALQTQIDGLSAASDVTDVVGTYAELQAYDTSKLKDNDIVKVLQDSTHDNAPSYYRWSTHTDTFTYIGSESASYTKAQADAKFETITSAAATYATQTALSTGLAGKASNADGTTIVDNGTNISTVAVKEQNNALAIKEWVGTSAQYEAITTKDPNTIYTVTDEADVAEIVVDSTLSPTSTNAIQNKAVYDALQDVDALPSQSGNNGKFLTTDGTNASWATVASGGIQNETTTTGALAIGGYNSTVGSSKGTQNTVLIGASAQATDSSTSYPSVVIGYSAIGKNHSVAIGRAANENRKTSTYNTTVGARANAHNNGVAVGYYANAYTNAVAIGGGTSTSARTNANGDGAIAIGKQAVAGGANTIQIGTGTNSTEGTVQILSYPIMDATGKIPVGRLPDGLYTTDTLIEGTAISLVDNNVNTVAITDFQNGGVKVPITQPSSAAEIVVHTKTPTSYSAITDVRDFTCFLDVPGGIFAQVWTASNAKINAWFTNNGTDFKSNYEVSPTMNTSSMLGVDFWWKMVWNGSSYAFSYKSPNQQTWYQVGSFSSSTAFSVSDNFAGLGTDIRDTRAANWYDGTFYLYDCTVKIDGNYTFNGATATASDYTIIGSPTITGSPAIAGGIKNAITFDPSKITGYNASGTFMLKLVNGVLTWVAE